MLSLVVAPGVVLATEVQARLGNPKGDTSMVGSLSHNMARGAGPYQVVGVVSVTIAAQYVPGAFPLVILNLVFAAITACWICVLVCRRK